jgi:GAF domain-containing protein
VLDSDNIQTGSERRRADILAAVSFTSNSLLQSGNWRDSLDASLRALGMASGANRAYFFENTTTDNGVVVTSQTAEWAAPGIEPQINNQDLQQVPFVEAGLARWLDQLEKGRPIYGSVAEFPESEQPLLLAQDIRSIVVMPVHTAGRLAGFLGFDDCEQQRAWTEPEFNALNAASSALV